MMNTTAIQETANAINSACPLIETPSPDSAAWDCVEGLPVREYFSRSPYSTIEAHRRGFVVHNLVTGGKHPCATWAQANVVRSAVANRYVTITNTRY